MASSPTAFAPQKPLEDPLAHLPCSSIVEYRKGQMIYNQDQPSTSIYLVIDGKVKVSRLADDGHQVVVDIYQPDEFFGESAFLNLPPPPRGRAAPDPCPADYRFYAPHRELLGGQHRPPPGALAHPLLRASRHARG